MPTPKPITGTNITLPDLLQRLGISPLEWTTITTQARGGIEIAQRLRYTVYMAANGPLPAIDQMVQNVLQEWRAKNSSTSS